MPAACQENSLEELPIKSYYESYWSEGGLRPYGELYPELESLLRRYVTNSSRCLDVGAGDAGTCGPWMKENAADYIGVDVSEAAQRLAAEAGFDVRLVKDASSLPFADASFDVAVSLEVLHFTYDPESIVREINRVLVPGGVLIVSMPNAIYWRRRVDAAIGRWNPQGSLDSVLRPWAAPSIRFFTPRAAEALMRTAGFEPVETKGIMGAFLADTPLLRRLSTKAPSAAYRWLEAKFPGLFAWRLLVTGRKS